MITVKCLEYFIFLIKLRMRQKSFASFVTETDGRGKRVHIQTLGQTFMPFIFKVLSVIGYVCKIGTKEM